jgi:drug/metabolite transporter (DMT)-like permease
VTTTTAAARARPSRPAIVGAMGLIYVVWGSTYVAIREAVRTLPPLLSAGARFVAAGALLAVVLRLRGAVPPTRREAASAVLAGTWMLVGGVGLVTLSETHVPANLAAVLASLTSIWIVLYRVADGHRPGAGAIAGIVLGLVGVAVLLLPAGGAAGASVPWLFAVVCSSLGWSSGSYYGTRLALPRDRFVAATVEMLGAGAVLCLAGVLHGEAGDVSAGRASAGSLLALAYLVVAGGVAFSTFVWLVDHLPMTTIVTHQYVNPVVAVLLGALLLGESLTARTLLGAALVIGAVALVVSSDR